MISLFAKLRDDHRYPLYRFGKIGNRFGYLLCTLKALMNFKPIKMIELNGATYCGKPLSSLFIANIQEVMGLGMSNLKSIPEDRLIESLAIHNLMEYLPFILGKSIYRFHPKLLSATEHCEIRFDHPPAVLS